MQHHPPPWSSSWGCPARASPPSARPWRSACGVPFADADDFHPQANIDKMSAGIPLTTTTGAPWLETIGAWLGRARGERRCGELLGAQARLPRRARSHAPPTSPSCTCTATRDVIAARVRPAGPGTSCPPPCRLAVRDARAPRARRARTSSSTSTSRVDAIVQQYVDRSSTPRDPAKDPLDDHRPALPAPHRGRPRRQPVAIPAGS